MDAKSHMPVDPSSARASNDHFSNRAVGMALSWQRGLKIECAKAVEVLGHGPAGEIVVLYRLFSAFIRISPYSLGALLISPQGGS